MPSRDLVVAAAGASAPSDPNFKNVSLLLSGDGTNGAQNNTFLDSSTNNFTITRNGNTTQGTFSPYGNLWSNYFDGSGDYLSIPDSTAWDFGTGDFTVEAWVNLNTVSSIQTFIGNYQNSTTGWGLQWRSDTGIWNFFNGDTQLITYTNTPTIGSWNHIAVSRSGTSLKMFLNGSQVASATNSTNITGSSNPLLIGALNGAGAGIIQYVNGYISNVRVVKGTAITPPAGGPTTPLTAVSGTSLLTCQSNSFIDNSSNNFAITVNGNTSVQRFSPFNPTVPYDVATIGGSGYFDGSGDWLALPANTAFNFGTGDFTVEGWVFPTSTSGTRPIVEIRTSAANSTGFALLSQSGATTLNVYTNGGFVGASTNSLVTNSWNYVALTRSGNTWTYWINGVSSGSFTNSSTQSDGATTGPKIGGSTTVGEIWVGFMSNIRIVKGTAVYTGNFTPPTLAPLAATGSASAACYPSTTNVNTSFTNTSLLCNFTNAGIPDLAMQNNLETVGNAQVSTSVKKYGTGSLYFDGTGDWLVLPVTPQTSLGTTYTIEGWIYLANTSGVKAIYGHSVASTSSYGYLLFYVTGTSLGFYVRPLTGGAEYGLMAGTLSATTWTHVAISVDNNSARMFINGTQVGSTTTVAATTYTPVYSTVGADIVQGYPMNGYIDDLRITKGLARYTANFTPPTAALPTY